jgi:HAMP domain-containing protein
MFFLKGAGPMSIKMRLLLSYIAMTVTPAILFALIAWGLSSAFFPDGARTGGGKPAFRERIERRDELIGGVRFVARTDPDRFADRKFLKRADEQLNREKAGIVVVRNGRITFHSPLVDLPHLDERLQELSPEPDRGPWGIPIDERFTVEKHELTFSDGAEGAVYVFSDIRWFVENGPKFFPLLLLSLLLVIGSTNGILTFLVSRSLIKPLSLLKGAAERIKDGDLDHEVRLHRRDEIGELGMAFEAMRRRLKESIRIQLQYEENRKQLLTHISHDLQTPLTGIKACIEGIRDGIAETGPMRENIGT